MSKFIPSQQHPETASSETDEVVHLKRLLVSLKQHYENSLHASQIQLQVEQNQKIALEKQVDELQSQLKEKDKGHEEELQALIQQLNSLKATLKKCQEELEKVKKEEAALETVVSTTSSYHLKQELEEIKKTLAQETKAMELRYIEVLNEKIGIEHKCKQLQLQLDHQSSNLVSFQGQMHAIEEDKISLDGALRSKDAELTKSFQQLQAMHAKIQELENKAKEKDFVQDKYEQLKDEWNQLRENLDEADEMRIQAEKQLLLMKENSAKQEAQRIDLENRLEALQEEGRLLAIDRDQLKIMLEESDTRLKVAQQHLAKKVKECTLLTERVEEQQNNLSDMDQTLEQQKTQIIQLQASVDLYQKQEKRLQEQLHDALKGTESQVAKWEEKYFRMYDKLQESENKIRELKKVEEKHLQMQHFFSNFGNFMGGTFHPPMGPSPFPIHPPVEPSSREGNVKKEQTEQERYDLFGMHLSEDPANKEPDANFFR